MGNLIGKNGGETEGGEIWNENRKKYEDPDGDWWECQRCGFESDWGEDCPVCLEKKRISSKAFESKLKDSLKREEHERGKLKSDLAKEGGGNKKKSREKIRKRSKKKIRKKTREKRSKKN
jgi:hypothetical protein